MTSNKQKGKQDPILSRLRKICLSLRDTTEVIAWGHPTFRVGGKIFVGYGHKTVETLGVINREQTRPTIGVKVGKDMQKELLRDTRFAYADYVGRFGWVTLTLSGKIDWNEIAGLVLTSYRLVAPARLLKQIDQATTTPKRSRLARARKKSGRR